MNNSAEPAALIANYRAAAAELEAAQADHTKLRTDHMAALKPAVARIAKASDAVEAAKAALLAPPQNPAA